jgi:hypothetical protein
MVRLVMARLSPLLLLLRGSHNLTLMLRGLLERGRH